MKNLLITTFLIKNIIAATIPTVPVSPFGKQKDICFKGNGIKYSVDGFPGTPYNILPFTETFVNPSDAQSKGTECREDGHCIRTYEIDVKETQKRIFDNTIPSCKKFPGTWFLSLISNT